MKPLSKTHITILGCGWLGKIVGKHFVEQGATVHGSVRNLQKYAALSEVGILPFQADFTPEYTIPDALVESDVVFIFLPPSSAEEKSHYPKLLVALAEQFSSSTRFFFSSSTGVYPRTEGTYTESFKIPESDRNYLFQAENQLRQLAEDRLTVLRLGGLIGPERHPIRSLQGRTVSLNAKSPVNLIHAGDITHAIEILMEEVTKYRVFNLVHPEHPTRDNYYGSAADFFGLERPVFEKGEAENRQISGAFIEEKTSFEYRFSPNDFASV